MMARAESTFSRPLRALSAACWTPQANLQRLFFVLRFCCSKYALTLERLRIEDRKGCGPQQRIAYATRVF